jgi:hypothetical protein
LRGEYRVCIHASEAVPGLAIYTVCYVYFDEAGAIVDVRGGAESLFDTDPGVVAGALIGMHRAFETPPIDLRGPKPFVCTEVLKT